MKIKNKLIILFLILTTTTISIINLKNTSKTYLYFLNFKTEKLTLGNLITISFLTGLTTTITFSYLLNPNKKIILNDENLDTNSEIFQENSPEKNTENKEFINERPPERDIRESQPTISVNYRVIKQNSMGNNDNYEGYTSDTYQNNDDWEEIDSNW